jgi:hypothetical protein
MTTLREDLSMRYKRWTLAVGAVGVLGLMAGVLYQYARPSTAAGKSSTSPEEVLREQEKFGTEAMAQVPLTAGQRAELAKVLEGPGNIGGFAGFYSEGQYVSLSPVQTYRRNGIFPGEVSYENFYTMHSGRVRWLLSVGLQDRKAVGETMVKMLQNALAAFPAASQQELEMYKSGEMGHGVSGPTPVEIVRAQAETAIYVLGEMRYYEGLKALFGAYCTQQAWVDAVPVEKYTLLAIPCPVPMTMSLFGLHRVIMAYPEAALGEKSRQALQAYKSWAEIRVGPAETYHINYAALGEGAATQRAFPANRVEYVHDWPVTFRDGTKMQKYDVAPYVTDQSKEWFGLMKAFVESLPQ